MYLQHFPTNSITLQTCKYLPVERLSSSLHRSLLVLCAPHTKCSFPLAFLKCQYTLRRPPGMGTSDVFEKEHLVCHFCNKSLWNYGFRPLCNFLLWTVLKCYQGVTLRYLRYILPATTNQQENESIITFLWWEIHSWWNLLTMSYFFHCGDYFSL